MDFTKNKKANAIENTAIPSESSGTESFLGSTVKIKGNISSDESLILEGKVNGNISSKNSITIGKSGNCTGILEADFVTIMGKAKGTIITGKKLRLLSKAKFEGNITSSNVIVEEGGIFNGNMNMSEKKGK